MGAELVRERLSRLIDGWGYDFSRFEISAFVRWVADSRGRSIELVPMTLPSELFGAWIEGDRTDYIFYEDEPLHVHTVHILLHELCHILLGHKTVHIIGQLELAAPTSAMQGTLGTQQVFSGLLRQVGYGDMQELEAETLSGLIQQKVFQQSGLEALSRSGQEPTMREFLQGLGMDQSSRR